MIGLKLNFSSISKPNHQSIKCNVNFDLKGLIILFRKILDIIWGFQIVVPESFNGVFQDFVPEIDGRNRVIVS